MPSLSTTALRLAVIEALAPTAMFAADDPAWPTLLGPRVLDCGSIPWDRSTPVPGEILGAVYVDEVVGEPRGAAQSYDPQFLTVHLIVDLEIPIVDGSGAMTPAAGDADATAKLEVAAAQIRRLLVTSPLLVPSLVRGYGRAETRWTRDPDLGVRLARLTLRLAIEIDDDDWGDMADGLPQPAASVAAALPSDSYGAAILSAVAATLTTPDDPSPLTRIRFAFGPDAPAIFEEGEVQGAVTFQE